VRVYGSWMRVSGSIIEGELKVDDRIDIPLTDGKLWKTRIVGTEHEYRSAPGVSDQEQETSMKTAIMPWPADERGKMAMDRIIVGGGALVN